MVGMILLQQIIPIFLFGMVKNATPTFSSSSGRYSWNMFTVDFFGTRQCRRYMLCHMLHTYASIAIRTCRYLHVSRQMVVLSKIAMQFVDATSLHRKTSRVAKSTNQNHRQQKAFFRITWNQPKFYADFWSIFSTFHQFCSWSHQRIPGTSRSWLPPLHATGRCAAPPCNNVGLARHAAGCREYEAKRRPRGRIYLGGWAPTGWFSG